MERCFFRIWTSILKTTWTLYIERQWVYLIFLLQKQMTSELVLKAVLSLKAKLHSEILTLLPNDVSWAQLF